MDWGLSFGVSPPSHHEDVHFHCAGFPLCSASTAWAFAKLGFCCAWPQPYRGWAEVVLARLNLNHGTRDVKGVCNFLGSVLLQQKFEAMDRPVLQLVSVTAQFYLASKKKYILEEWGRASPKEVWCWRRLLRVPWTARISNQSILKEISPEYSLEGLMLTLKLQYFGRLM